MSSRDRVVLPNVVRRDWGVGLHEVLNLDAAKFWDNNTAQKMKQDGEERDLKKKNKSEARCELGSKQ